jgi:hypothetical protein
MAIQGKSAEFCSSRHCLFQAWSVLGMVDSKHGRSSQGGSRHGRSSQGGSRHDVLVRVVLGMVVLVRVVLSMVVLVRVVLGVVVLALSVWCASIKYSDNMYLFLSFLLTSQTRRSPLLYYCILGAPKF